MARPVTQVLSAGESPRRTLRWGFKKGSKETLEIQTELTSTPAGGAPYHVPLVYTVTVEAKEVASDGTAQVGFKVESVEAPEDSSKYSPEQFGLLQTAVGSVRWQSGTYSVDSRGVISGFHLDSQIGGDDSVEGLLRRLLHGTIVPVPAEEVGRGSTWTVRRVVQEGRIRIEEVSTVELTKIEGSRVEISLKTEGTGPRPDIGSAGARPGETESLPRVESRGTGAGTWDLTKLVPLTFKTESSKKTTILRPKGDGTTRAIEHLADTAKVMTRK